MNSINDPGDFFSALRPYGGTTFNGLLPGVLCQESFRSCCQQGLLFSRLFYAALVHYVFMTENAWFLDTVGHESSLTTVLTIVVYDGTLTSSGDTAPTLPYLSPPTLRRWRFIAASYIGIISSPS